MHRGAKSMAMPHVPSAMVSMSWLSVTFQGPAVGTLVSGHVMCRRRWKGFAWLPWPLLLKTSQHQQSVYQNTQRIYRCAHVCASWASTGMLRAPTGMSCGDGGDRGLLHPSTLASEASCIRALLHLCACLSSSQDRQAHRCNSQDSHTTQ